MLDMSPWCQWLFFDMPPWWFWLFLTCPPDGNHYLWKFSLIEQELDACIVLGPCQLEVMEELRGGRGETHVTKLNVGKEGNKSWGELTSPPVPLPLIPPPLPLPPPWNSTCKQIKIEWEKRTFKDSKADWTFPLPLIAPLAPPFCPETSDRRRRSRKIMHNWKKCFSFLNI